MSIDLGIHSPSRFSYSLYIWRHSIPFRVGIPKWNLNWKQRGLLLNLNSFTHEYLLIKIIII